MDQNNGFDREEETKNERYPAYPVINGAGSGAFGNDTYYGEGEKENKRGKGLPVLLSVLLCALCVLVGAGVTLGILSARNAVKKDVPAQTEETAPITDPAKEQGAAASADTGASQSVPADTGGDEEPALPSLPVNEPVFSEGNGKGEAMSAKEIYSANVPAVVGIVAEGTTRNIFGMTSKTASSGTGFLLTADGYIMTNNHVIDSGSALTVTLYDGRSFKASVVGADADNDVAVLKIEASGLPALTLGDSEAIAVGDEVCVIGNPLGELTFTMTRGIVSALNRTINADSSPIRMFQIDAAVNSGNSGGPAFNERGEVIGIVTAKYSSDSIEGIGFCIPIDDAKTIADDLIRYGYVRGKTTIGVEVVDALEAYDYFYRYYGRRGRDDFLATLSRTGAYVNSVQSGSAADKAGIEAGDTILAWNGKEIADAADFENALKEGKPGETVTLTVLEDGISTKVTVILDELIPTGITPEARAENISFR